MELLQTIALLCQLSGDAIFLVKNQQLECQQSYLNCVSKRRSITVTEKEALEKCVLEK